MITKQQVGDLLRYETGCWPVVSFYLHVDGRDRSLHQCTERTHQLIWSARSDAESQAMPEQAHTALLNDFDRIMHSIETDWAVGENKGLAIFACSAVGMWRAYPLPCRVPDSIRVAHKPYVRPLASLLSQHLRSGVVVIDREKTRLFRFHGGELQLFGEIVDPFNVTEMPSLPVDDFAKVVVEAQMLEYLTRVEDSLSNMVERARLKRLVVLGTAEMLVLFLNLLPKSLSEHTIGSEDTSPQDLQDSEIVHRVETILAGLEQHDENELVCSIREAASPGGLGVIGLEETLRALSSHSLKTLAVDLDLKGVGYCCDRCHYMFSSYGACPQCGESKPNVVEDIVEAAINGAIRQGVKVRFVSSNRPWSEAGGIGGLLAFRPPRDRPS
jgi:peptide subunit release factor 1 (eRF1)